MGRHGGLLVDPMKWTVILSFVLSALFIAFPNQGKTSAVNRHGVEIPMHARDSHACMVERNPSAVGNRHGVDGESRYHACMGISGILA